MFIFTMYLNLESKVQWGFDFQFAIPLPNSKKILFGDRFFWLLCIFRIEKSYQGADF